MSTSDIISGDQAGSKLLPALSTTGVGAAPSTGTVAVKARRGGSR